MRKKTGAATRGRLPDSFEDLCTQVAFPRVIRDDVSYENALEIVERLVTLQELTDGQRGYLDTFTTLIEAYEAQTYGAPKDDPVGALRFLMDANGMNVSDLSKLLGDPSRSVGSRVMSGERQLSRSHIATLCNHFRVSADLFL